MTRYTIAIATLILGLSLSPRAEAQMTVTDLTNFAQNLITALETVDQTLTQIQQYQTQLLQYENMIRNSAAPAVYAWDLTQSIRNKLQQLANYRAFLLDLDAYLKKYGDLNYYRASPCYGRTGNNVRCPKEEWDRMMQETFQQHSFAASTQQQNLDYVMQTMEASEQDLFAQSQNLEKIQRQSEKADGQMKVLQAANQFANAEVQQLMEIRAIMVVQYRALAAEAVLKHAEKVRNDAVVEAMMKPGEVKKEPQGLKEEVWFMGPIRK